MHKEALLLILTYVGVAGTLALLALGSALCQHGG